MIVTVSKDEMSKLGVFTCLGLKAKHSSTFHRGSCGIVEISLDDSEDEPTHLGEKFSVVPQEYSQVLWQRKGHESVGKAQQKIILHVLDSEERRSFLGARRLRVATRARTGRTARGKDENPCS